MDWKLAELLYEGETAVIYAAARELLSSGEQLTAEALLHAHGKRPRGRWAEPIIGRWRQVRAPIAMFEQEGLATKFDDLDVLATKAYMTATGATVEEIVERFDEPELAHSVG